MIVDCSKNKYFYKLRLQNLFICVTIKNQAKLASQKQGKLHLLKLEIEICKNNFTDFVSKSIGEKKQKLAKC